MVSLSSTSPPLNLIGFFFNNTIITIFFYKVWKSGMYEKEKKNNKEKSVSPLEEEKFEKVLVVIFF